MADKLLPTTPCPNLGKAEEDSEYRWVQDRCCCNCKWHRADHRHCSVDRKPGESCVCSEQKGWICLAPEMNGRVYSGWGEHGLCEMHSHVCTKEAALFVRLPDREAKRRLKSRKKK